LVDKSSVFNTARMEALELDNLLEVAEATAISADTVMSGTRKVGGASIASLTSTVPRWASMAGAMRTTFAWNGWSG
jgi:hypothetical protein